MTDREKMELIEGVLEVQRGSLRMESSLVDTGAYDSMAMLSLAVMIENRFGVTLTGDMVRSLVTVRDVANLMEGEPRKEPERPIYHTPGLCETLRRKFARWKRSHLGVKPPRSEHPKKRFA